MSSPSKSMIQVRQEMEDKLETCMLLGWMLTNRQALLEKLKAEHRDMVASGHSTMRDIELLVDYYVAAGRADGVVGNQVQINLTPG